MEKILNGITTSLVDAKQKSSSFFQHQLINNNEHTMYYTIKKLLNECDEFYFSVAFITMSGLQLLKKTLIDLENKQVKGKVVTGNYLHFTDPHAVSVLNQFENIDVKINCDNNLHTKGYFFKINDTWKIVVGSSNLTRNALLLNQEWNLVITSSENGKIVEDALNNFNRLFSISEDFSSVIAQYIDIYLKKKQYNAQINKQMQSLSNYQGFTPNSMQTAALASLHSIRENGENKALVISATGSGKTILSAFDVKAFNARKCLFIVHSNTILESSYETYSKILTSSLGMFNGQRKEVYEDCIFANIATLQRNNNLFAFSPDEFDYIIIDEVHKAGAKSYNKILEYFKPKFLLGMSATPERNDEFNIYNLFDNNIAYEIRLKEAINENLIVPFHYYGVCDVYNDENFNISYNDLNVEMRVDNLLEKSAQYGYDGDKVRGLIFVSSIAEAKRIADLINTKFYRAVALTGNSSQHERQDAIRRIALSSQDTEYIDYIVIVDIFNEGIDIPSINQVLLLRETNSKIIYTQQIGRGLRKYTDKEYLVIIDFIGNYKHNFLIPSVLSGDNSFDLDKSKNTVISGVQGCPDGCTVEFEQIAQNIVLNNLSQNLKRGNASLKNIFISDFKVLEQRLNRMPLLQDFYDNNLIEPDSIVNIRHKSKRITYYHILQEFFNYKMELPTLAAMYTDILYLEFCILKRAHEYIIIKALIEGSKTFNELNEIVEHTLNMPNQEFYTRNALEHLSFETFTKDQQRKDVFNTLLENGNTIITNNEKIKLDSYFLDLYSTNDTFKMLINDIINVNLSYTLNTYKQQTINPLILHEDYTKKEIFHIVGDDYNSGTIISGYREFKEMNTVMIFVKLEDSPYANKFISPSEFKWMTQNNKYYGKSRLETDMIDNKLEIQVFIRKKSGEKYYYLGNAKIVDHLQKTNLIECILKFDDYVEDNLYTYLTSNIE